MYKQPNLQIFFSLSHLSLLIFPGILDFRKARVTNPGELSTFLKRSGSSLIFSVPVSCLAKYEREFERSKWLFTTGGRFNPSRRKVLETKHGFSRKHTRVDNKRVLQPGESFFKILQEPSRPKVPNVTSTKVLPLSQPDAVYHCGVCLRE